MHYFAYGSNMAARRLRHRLPSAQLIGPAWLAGYRLVFNVRSLRDGSAKANAVRQKAGGQLLCGVLYRIDAAEKPLLDRCEGIGVEYRDAWVRVALEDGRVEKALIYLGVQIDETCLPYHWYKEHVLRGARESGLPQTHLEQIRSIRSIADPDPGRTAAELKVYR